MESAIPLIVVGYDLCLAVLHSFGHRDVFRGRHGQARSFRNQYRTFLSKVMRASLFSEVAKLIGSESGVSVDHLHCMLERNRT